MNRKERDTEFGGSAWAQVLGPSLRLGPALRYASAPVATLLAGALQYVLLAQPSIAPYLFCALAVAVASWVGGRGPGLLAVILTAAMAGVLFIAPAHGGVAGRPVVAATLLYLVAATPIALVFALTRETMLRAEGVFARLRRQTELVDLSQDAIFVWRLPGGTIESWNRGAERLYGIAAADAVGRPPRELLRTVYSVPWPQIEAELRRHERWEGELIHRTRGGHAITVWSRWQLVRGADGVERVLESTRDVTERKRVEEERSRLIVQLDSERRRMETILEQSPVGIGIADAQSGKVDYGNKRLHEILGPGGLQSLASPPAGDGAALRALGLDGAPVAAGALPMARALRGELVRGEELRVVAGSPDAPASQQARPRVVSVNAAPIRAASGEITGALLAAQDVTEQKRAEIRLRRLYESGMIGVFYWFAEGRVSEANDKFLAMTGYSRADLETGRLDWRRMTPPEYRRADDRALEAVDRSGATAPLEKQYLRKDGSRLPVLVGAATLDETRREGLAFVIDISDRKRAEAERERLVEDLREADRRKDEFLAVLSHELRNPLAPVRNSVVYLLRGGGAGLDGRGRQAATVIERQVAHLARLVDDLLDATRLTRGTIRLQRARVDLGELVRRAVEDYRPVLTANGVGLELAIDDRHPLAVEGDAARLSQVVGSLLQNAGKFTPAGGKVSVTVGMLEEDGGGGSRAVVEVRDNGIGIDAETLKRLFQPFAQADQSLARTRGGLGLGLALAKGLVEMHGGTIEAFSDGPGRGARFTVRVPMAAAARAVAAPRPALTLALAPARAGEAAVDGQRPRTAAAAEGRQTMRQTGRAILIVEDNRDSADSLKDVLELAGHRVSVAYDGQEGLQMARALRPDVVLCDIGLPLFDGYRVAEALRADRAFAGTCLIALSGYTQPEDVERAQEAGFDRHIAKPPDLEVLGRAMMMKCDGAGRAAAVAGGAPRRPSIVGAGGAQMKAVPRRQRVLLVDDEDGFRESLAGILRDAGFEVVEAHDGAECLEVVKKGPTPDATLLDYRMPGLSGGEVFERLQSQGRAEGVVLMTSASAAPEIASRHHFHRYLGKPFAADDAIEIVRALLRERARKDGSAAAPN